MSRHHQKDVDHPSGARELLCFGGGGYGTDSELDRNRSAGDIDRATGPRSGPSAQKAREAVRETDASALTPFRFRWRRRLDWGIEAYDAFEGEFRLAQVIRDGGATGTLPLPYRWMISAFYMGEQRAEPKGAAGSPREAAREVEQAFEENLPKVYGFHMRTESAVELCRLLAIELPPQTRWQAEKFGIRVSESLDTHIASRGLDSI